MTFIKTDFAHFKSEMKELLLRSKQQQLKK